MTEAVFDGDVAEIEGLAKKLHLSLDQVLEDLRASLLQRLTLLALPLESVGADIAIGYVKKVLGERATPQVLAEFALHVEREPVSDRVYTDLLVRQANRCAVCGRRLMRHVRPQVDHVLPVALGGLTETRNLRTLCRSCNQGKGMLLGWPLAAPHFETIITPRLRFFVLDRARGVCQHADCEFRVLETELRPTLRTPHSEGGRTVLDNLYATCEMHYSQIQDQRIRRWNLGCTGTSSLRLARQSG